MKIGPNEQCPCNSNKKYKKCCFVKDEEKKQQILSQYTKGESEPHTVKMEICKNHYKEHYKNMEIIVISNYLVSEPVYKKYQICHYNKNIIMIAEKNEYNEPYFESKCGKLNDIIVMFRGSYRTFEFKNLLNVYESVDKMIQTRLSNKFDDGQH